MLKPSLIIPDASVVLSYILNEPEYATKTALLFERSVTGENQLLAPPILHEEICNRLSRIADFSISSIQAALEAYAIIKLTPPVITQALELTRKFSKIVWYDAIYHSVALEYGGILITADKIYYQTAKNVGHILFIADYR